MKGMIILADGFEDVEAFAVIDILNRGGINIDKVIVNNVMMVESKYKIQLMGDQIIEKIDINEYDFLVLPGGPAVKTHLIDDELVLDIVKYFSNNNKLIAAICAAPSILEKLGLLGKYTAFCKTTKEGENYLKNENVVFDKNIITAKSMYYSIEFGLKILEVLTSKEKVLEVFNSIRSL